MIRMTRCVATCEVSCEELDVAVEVRAAGAYGARMTGGGFGGRRIALVARDALVWPGLLRTPMRRGWAAFTIRARCDSGAAELKES